MKPEEAAFQVMLEAVQIIQDCGELVIVGGWVPDLHYPRQGHVGSIDVDMVLAPDSFPADIQLHQHLTKRGYTRSEYATPTRYLYPVLGLEKEVALDLLTTPWHQGRKTPSIEIGGLSIGSLPGLDLALKCYEPLTIPRVDAQGDSVPLTMKVARPEAFVLIKAFPLNLRNKPKDAYDIAFVLQHYKPNLSDLAGRMSPLISSEDSAGEAYEVLLEKFRFVDAEGPEQAALFAREVGQDPDLMRRAVYEDMQTLFHWINIAIGDF